MTLITGADNDLFTFDLREVETVKRLTDAHQDEVGDIHDAVYRTQTDGHQKILQPFGRGAYLDIAYCHS